MGSMILGTKSPDRTTKSAVKTRLLLPVLALATLGATSCGGDNSIQVTDAWARSSPAMTTMGAAYMNIEAAAGDTLIGVSVPATIAERAEIHEMVPASSDMDSMDMGDDSSDMDSMDEAMVMQQIMSLELPAGEVVELKPGGYHVMLIGLAAPLEIGTNIDVTLDFETAADMTITVEVREG
jgi:copper(I)-binding protein